MAIKSLNEAYEQKSIVYLCNACGEINNPEDPGDLSPYQPEDMMSPQEQDLYEQYWLEDGACCRYVLRVEGKPALGLCYLFSRSWCREVVKGRRDIESEQADSLMDSEWMPRMFMAVYDAATDHFEAQAPGCDLYIGENTDPDGHELLVVIPYHLRDRINETADRLNASVFCTVESTF